MSATLPLHRRSRVWYGTRTAEPSRRAADEHPHDAARVRIAELAVAPLPAEIRQAPFDRRATSLL